MKIKEIIVIFILTFCLILATDKRQFKKVKKFVRSSFSTESVTPQKEVENPSDLKVQKNPEPKVNKVYKKVEQKPKKVVIKGLGDFNQSTLNEIASDIEEFYGYDCVIESSVPTNEDMYTKDGRSLEIKNCIPKLKREGTKMIYVTNENLVSDDMELRGGTIYRSNTVILESGRYNQKTILHEIGHTLGLEHCDNKNCLMSIHNDDHVVEDFCEKCKKTLKENEKFQ